MGLQRVAHDCYTWVVHRSRCIAYCAFFSDTCWIGYFPVGILPPQPTIPVPPDYSEAVRKSPPMRGFCAGPGDDQTFQRLNVGPSGANSAPSLVGRFSNLRNSPAGVHQTGSFPDYGV